MSNSAPTTGGGSGLPHGSRAGGAPARYERTDSERSERSNAVVPDGDSHAAARTRHSAQTDRRRAYADAWCEFLGRWAWEWFVTLTFRCDVHPEAAHKLYRVWLSKLNRQAHGAHYRRHGQGLIWVRAEEPQRSGRLHYHGLMGGLGIQKIRRLDAMDLWFGLDRNSQWHKHAPRPGFARVQPPRCIGAVRGYVAKYVVKGGEIDYGGPGLDLTRPSGYVVSAGRDWRPSAPLWWPDAPTAAEIETAEFTARAWQPLQLDEESSD